VFNPQTPERVVIDANENLKTPVTRNISQPLVIVHVLLRLLVDVIFINNFNRKKLNLFPWKSVIIKILLNTCQICQSA